MTVRVMFDKDLADRLKADAGKPYQPSSGSEGEAFFSHWCNRCARDASMNGSKDYDDCAPNEICPIIAASMAFKPGDAEYPVAWIFGTDGQPQCSAFVPVEQGLPPERCAHTPDMFGSPPLSDSPHQQQDHDDQQHDADAAGRVVAEIGRVRLDRKRPNERED